MNYSLLKIMNFSWEKMKISPAIQILQFIFRLLNLLEIYSHFFFFFDYQCSSIMCQKNGKELEVLMFLVTLNTTFLDMTSWKNRPL